jgi:hypothetical protein
VKWDSRRTVLLDANLLVLFVVGVTDSSRIEAFSRTSGYTTTDFEILMDLIGPFQTTATTPHILSQASDLIRRSNAYGSLLEGLTATLRNVYVISEEHHVLARELSQDAIFSRYGLADAAVLDAASRGCTVLTADVSLNNIIRASGFSSFNFTEFRDL